MKYSVEVPINVFGILKPTGCKFLRIDNRLPMEDLYQFIVEDCDRQKPALILSVYGGAKYFTTTERLEKEIIRGVIHAATMANAWILTAGIDNGISKLVGEGISHYRLLQEYPLTVKCIGMTTWGTINEDTRLELKSSSSRFPTSLCQRQIPDDAQEYKETIERNHTHCILFDGGKLNEYLSDAHRDKFVIAACKDTHNDHICFPVTIMVEGGLGSLEVLENDLKAKRPIVLIQGSGRLADALAMLIEQTSNSDRNQYRIQSEQEIEQALDRFFPSVSYSDIGSATKRIQKILQEENRYLLHVFSMNRDKNIVNTIFKAIFTVTKMKNKNEPSKQEQRRNREDELIELAFEWNYLDGALPILQARQDEMLKIQNEIKIQQNISSKLYHEYDTRMTERWGSTGSAFLTVLSNVFYIMPYILFYLGLGFRYSSYSESLLTTARIIWALDLELWYLRSLKFVIAVKFLVVSRSLILYKQVPFTGRGIFVQIFYEPYWLLYGDVSDKNLLDDIINSNSSNATGNVAEATATHVLLAFHMLFINILLLSLLTAVFAIIWALDLELWYLRSLKFVIAVKFLGLKLFMLENMLRDLFAFVYMIFIALTAYGVVSRALILYKQVPFTGRGIFGQIFYEPYWLIYGDVSDKNLLDEIINSDNGSTTGNVAEATATHVLLAFHMLFINILLLSLITAVFTHSVDHVRDNSDFYWRHQRYSFVREYFEGLPLSSPPLIFISHIMLLFLSIRRKCCSKLGRNQVTTENHIPLSKKFTRIFKMIPTNDSQNEQWDSFENVATYSYVRSILDKNEDTVMVNDERSGEIMMAIDSNIAETTVNQQQQIENFKNELMSTCKSVLMETQRELEDAIYDLLGEENRKGENSPAKRVEKIMTKLDSNGDRSLTKDEFINGCLQDDFLKNLLAPNA
ncbi:unnamed protein product [Rotaria sp. Silwood1]|nr:unnamed protein product [Rotaria sp. Silwood1]